MKKIDSFVGCYPISKTLRFKAIPVGKTQDNIDSKKLLEEDEQKAKDYKEVKKLIDRYHRRFIENVLGEVKLTGIGEYIELYNQNNKTDEEMKRLTLLEEEYRKVISKAFVSNKEYSVLFKAKIIKEVLPGFLDNEKEIESVNVFNSFYTAFRGYNKNRENMYSHEKKSTAISYRIINENLPRYISNINVFDKVKYILESDKINAINNIVLEDTYNVEDMFRPEFFECVLTQRGIDTYNAVIGGIVTDNGQKIQGLNECINLYNQENKDKLPKLKSLYKQVLSEKSSMSFYIDEVNDDSELVEMLTSVFDDDSALSRGIRTLRKIVIENDYDINGIYVNNGPAISAISNDVFGSWIVISDNWKKEYDKNSRDRNKETEKYDEKRRKEFKKIESFSLFELQRLGEENVDLYKKLLERIQVMLDEYDANLHDFEKYICDYDNNKRISTDKVFVEKIKKALDSIKLLENYLVPLLGTGKEDNRDERFYGDFVPCIDGIRSIDIVYNKIRNYLTKKPYSKEKFKLYFENPQLMDGWDINKESDHSCALLVKNEKYYLAILDNKHRGCLKDIDAYSENYYEKIIYKQIPQASKYLSSKQIIPQNPPENITKILEKKKEKGPKALTKKEVIEFIDYLSNDFLVNYSLIIDKNGNNYFDFDFGDPSEYESLNAFFEDVDRQAYSIKYERIPIKVVDELVRDGKLYLFQLYNKDFSEKSHGIENLHTMYFKALFDERNNGEIRLNGFAEMFMRRASLSMDKVAMHPANTPITNKNSLNPKKSTTLPYNVYKDRRFTEDQYEVHIPITMNTVPMNPYKVNHLVREQLVKDDNPYVIGIDRGERNLLYVVVIDSDGKIVEQYSLNEIVNKVNGIEIKTDYHSLLDKKEKERDKSRKGWKEIENIKELKEGYVSQVVHKICELVEKYDAVIALEDLNSGFKNSRTKVEKQVYQKFEKMLITKLNYMVDKKKDIDVNGGVLKGYQLTTQFESFSKMGLQNGIMFYIPAWLTSKIDPTTGFVNFLYPKYKNKNEAKSFISKFEKVSYDKKDNMFVFDIDYNNFPRTESDYNKKWKIYTNGERIKVFRNPEKNGEFDYRVVNLTEEMKELLDTHGISYESGGLKEIICNVDDARFYKKFMELFALTLQMRNSITGRVDVDYLISPVKNADGEFYNSENYKNEDNPCRPKDADANGAFNIARKALWAIERFKEEDEEKLDKTKISINKKEWLKYAQTHGC